jgi:hypothetical protein
MNPADNTERAVARLHITTRAGTDKHILDDAFAALHGGLQKQQLLGFDIGVCRTAVILRWPKPALVAAVILVACALFFSVFYRKGATPGEIHKAFGKAENTCISTFQAGKTEPFQQVWASQTLHVKLFKIGGGNQAQFTLWDAPNKARMMRYLSSESVRTEAITEQMFAELDKSVAQSSGLFPFSDANAVPEGAQWSGVDDPQVAAAIPETEVYDLAWTAKIAPSEAVVYKKWRLFADIGTYLPKRAEWYAKYKPEEEYTFETFVVVSYPSESEIHDLIDNIFGPRRGRPDEPEYIGTPGTER